jgi:HAMP domain-containing protein
MHRTRSRKLITENNLLLNGEEYIATALKGIELADAVIMAVYPRKIILDRINNLFSNVILAALASLLLVAIIVVFFSRRLLVPISGLAEGVRAIARRDFKHRIDFVSKDEFGQLIGVFNDTIAGMQEIAVGTAVQKSLLPPGKCHAGKFSLYARSEFMSRMGGDYFDYFKLPEERLGVFFGDVAGHGIPAALVMSMAKAVVANARAAFNGPAALLHRANSIFLHLKEKGWRRMMTAQCLELDCNSGKFKLANAGQCFPVIVGEDRAGVTYVKAVGMPLGNVTRKPYAEITGELKPGDTLILYTDGIIEATDASGNVFDFAGFEKLLLASWNSDLEVWWQDIFNGYSGFAAAQDDDVTMLMLKYEK